VASVPLVRLVCWLLLGAALAAPSALAQGEKTVGRKPPVAELQKTIEEQRALILDLKLLIVDQQARIAQQEARLAEQDARIEAQTDALAADKIRLAEMEARLATLTEQMQAVQAELPAALAQQDLAERLKAVEEASEKTPELLAEAVAGEFPGSIRIPGTDAAIKFGGRVRTAGVFTLDPLGSEDRFLTNSIPVEPDDAGAGKGSRTTFSANTSRFNVDVRTPTGRQYMRAFLEGDFFGSDASEKRTNFRLRHAFARFKGILVGQTWSTFSDPAADHQDLDFEGINGENVIRQPQFRYTWQVGDDLSVAAAAETPEVSLTGGKGVNVVPDLVGRAVWTIKETGHLQTAVVLREIRGEWDQDPGRVQSDFAWGATFSGVVPFRYFDLTDRLIFQLNLGRGIARYINDLNSLGGQDAVFDADGNLEALFVEGGYVDFEHQWKRWETTRVMNLRSSVIWSYVFVHNLSYQPDDAYRRTSRLSVNLVFSPIERIDIGAEYIYGKRVNKDGQSGTAGQVQIVGIFRF
jgi:uncharacterized coiled-coil protein SlyX